MSGGNSALRAVLIERYDHLRGELERCLRSRDLAQEALHDTYVKLQNGEEIRPVEKPVGYLIRVAINVARDRQRSAKRLATMDEIETALNLADDGADPERTAEARSDLEAVTRLINALPERRRAILLASYKENLLPAEIARRFGVTKRRINMELKLGREYCLRALSGRPKK